MQSISCEVKQLRINRIRFLRWGVVTATLNNIAALKHSDNTLNSFVQFPAQNLINNHYTKHRIADLKAIKKTSTCVPKFKPHPTLIGI